MCQKKVRRGMKNLFDIYSCNSCRQIYLDEEITIGKIKLYIYYLKKCDLEVDNFSYSKKLIQIIYEYILNESNDLLIIEEYNKIKQDDLEVLINMGKNIHIIN